jgi:hypothetical protein
VSNVEGMLPNLFLAGAPKAGTSSVHDWLSAHPQVLGSDPKETDYFTDPGWMLYDASCHIANGLDDYQRFFLPAKKVSPAVILESTPGYLYGRTALGYLPDLPSEPRFLFILREPADQIYSVYNYAKNNWASIPLEMSFSDFIQALRMGETRFGNNELANHALRPYLVRWRERVGTRRMKVMLFDDLRKDQRQFMRSLCDWLEIDPDFFDDYDFPRSNETYNVRWHALQKLNVAARRTLQPLGPVYRWLRRAYRSVNTHKPPKPPEEDAAVLRELESEFALANARLEQEFGLDLSAWRNKGGRG